MIKNICYLLLASCLYNNTLMAGSDLDDGIDAADTLEDSIQIQKNIQYIIRNAKAKASRESSSVVGCDGAGNMTFGPGTKLNGATIINLSKNKGTSSVCIEK